jgi:predicted RecA/RadA family phage recombinase
VAKNFKQEGKRINFTASAAVVSGDLLIMGELAAVALTDVDSGAKGVAAVEGVWELPKKATGVINQGDKVYWDADGNPYVGDAGSGCLTNAVGHHTHEVTVTGESQTTDTETEEVVNVYVGIAWAAAGASDPTVQVKINA